MQDSFPDHVFKLLLIGNANVGKSSILLRYVDNTFSETMSSTIGVDFKGKMVDVRGQRVKLTIWDTAGQERFRTLTSSYYRGCHAVILTYDCTDRESFERLEDWLKEVEMFSHSNNPVKMVIANKIDQPNHAVTKNEGIKFARDRGMMFMQCSAKTRVGIHQAFEEIVEKIMDDPSLLATSTPKPAVAIGAPQEEQGCC